MSVRKRQWKTASGEVRVAWIADYLDASGERHVEQFGRMKDAKDREAKVRGEIKGGTYHAPNTRLIIKEAAAKWIAQCKANNLEAATIRQYQQHIDLHIMPRLGNVRLAKLTTDMIEQHLRNDLLDGEHKVSRSLARKVLTSFKSLLKANKRSDIIADVAAIRGSKRERKPLEPGHDIPEPSEITRMINAATKPRQRALLLTAALTGLRASELRALRWKDVDLEHGLLHVRQRADRYNVIGLPKSKAGTRTIEIDAPVIAALKKWKVMCPQSKPGVDRLVFPTKKGAIEHYSNIERGVNPVMIAAGVVDANGAPKYGMHAFRHFFASWCINPKNRGGRELPAKEVQHLLGHSSIVITLDTYGHLFPSGGDTKELAAATAALIGGAPTGTVVTL